MPDTPFTPAITLVIQLKKALDLIKQEGMENIWKRHASLAKATRTAVQALGLKLYAPSAPPIPLPRLTGPTESTPG